MTDMRITGINGPSSRVPRPAGARSQGEGFGELLQRMVREVNEMQERAGDSVRALSMGEVQDLHQVMIEMNKAELGFRFLLEVRNKIVDAYQEVSRMSI